MSGMQRDTAPIGVSSCHQLSSLHACVCHALILAAPIIAVYIFSVPDVFLGVINNVSRCWLVVMSWIDRFHNQTPR